MNLLPHVARTVREARSHSLWVEGGEQEEWGGEGCDDEDRYVKTHSL